MKTSILNKLSVRLILSLSFVLIITTSIFTYFILSSLETDLTKTRFQSAYNLADIITKSTRYSMLLNRNEDVRQIITTIGTEEGVKGIRIYNKQGEIIYSTDSTEIFQMVDMNAEACYKCHQPDVLLKSLTPEDRMRIITTESGERTLGLINPIKNEPDCSSAPCHAHSPEIEILGVLDVMLSLKALDEIKATTRSTIIINSTFIIISIALFSGFFIVILVNKPIKRLTNGIKEVGSGNLKYKIDVKSNDELGQVAKQFNAMSIDLDKAYQEIKDWSETLNLKVMEKTEELKKIYDQVIQIEKLASLGKLSATVAHELNNPLEGILTYSKLVAKMLRKNQTNNEYENMINYLELISDESSRCGKIVKDLLLFSHKGDEELIDDNIISVVDKSIKLIKHHLHINNIKLEKEFSTDNITLKCNPQKIQQALMSILINGIEAMSVGGTLKVKVNEEKGIVVIRITDQGNGIAEIDLPHIFEPFFSTKEIGKGTGLGLAVTYGIIKQHNGVIEVEKTSEKGTTFKISIPTKHQN